jgi:quinol monooxygenase YgiN
MTLVLIAELTAKAGLGERLLKELEPLVAASLAEAGCLAYQPHVTVGDPDRVVIIEEWADQAALDLHTTLPHYTQAGAALGAILAKPPLLRRLVDAG